MIRIMCLDPVTLGTTADEQAYIGKYLDKDTALFVDGIKEGPHTIQCEYDEAMAQPAVIKLCQKAESEGIQGIFVNCFGDPGVRAAREVVKIPVFGGFEPVMNIALGVGDKIAILTVLDNVLPLINNNVAKAGLKDRVVCVKSVGIPVDQLTQKEKLVAALVEQGKKAITENDAQVIVLGCTAMIDVAEEVEQQLKMAGYDVPVLEAAQTGVKMVELFASMGISHSRLTYRPLPQ